MQDFRRLDIWKRGHALALNIRRLADGLPRRNYASFKSQMIRAAESIPFNIVEGCGADGRKEFSRFLGISVKSSFELEYQLQLAKDSGALDARPWHVYASETVEVRRMLCGFRRALSDADQEEQGIRRRTEQRAADSRRGPTRRGPPGTEPTDRTDPTV